MALFSQRQTISFVVRLWQESSTPDGPAKWRGQIEHVDSGERTHFQLPQALIDYLMTIVEARKPQ